MESFRLVHPENLNHFGFLFGGYMLKWVDEMAWIAASMEYPACKFVTIGMDQVEFKKSVREGTILRFQMTQTHKGRTSVRYLVDVRAGNKPETDEESIFSTTVTMVRVDENGQKMALPE